MGAADAFGKLPVARMSTPPAPRCSSDAGRVVHPPIPVELEPVGQQTGTRARATSKSAMSRQFVAATENALAELLTAHWAG